VRRVAPERTEFLIEILATATTAAQVLRDHHARSAQIAQTVAPLGVQATDLLTISMNVMNSYSPMLQQLPPFAAPPQIGPGGLPNFGAGVPGMQPEIQFGSYQARSWVRVNVRDRARVGEVIDAVTKAGASLLGGFSFHAADEGAERKAALESAGRDARAKAEALASAAGKEIGAPLAISEELLVSNGVYSALRAQSPIGFAPGSPVVAGELEYYARVTATFRFQ
jgi:uncharacterized protein YggE